LHAPLGKQVGTQIVQAKPSTVATSLSSHISTWIASLSHMCSCSSWTGCCSSGYGQSVDRGHHADSHAELTVNHVSFREPPRQHGASLPSSGHAAVGASLPSSGLATVGMRHLPQLRQLPQLDKIVSMSHTEKAHAKKCLHEEVKAFTERALYGEDCHVVNAASGQVAPAKYVIDEKLAKMTITPVDQRIPAVTCQLQRLRFVGEHRRGLAEAGDHITAAARSHLTPDLLSRLAVLEFDVDGETHALAVLVLLPSSMECDHFVMCVNVLRHFAQQSQQSTLG